MKELFIHEHGDEIAVVLMKYYEDKRLRNSQQKSTSRRTKTKKVRSKQEAHAKTDDG